MESVAQYSTMYKGSLF